MILKAIDTATALFQKAALLLIAFFCMVCAPQGQQPVTTAAKSPNQLAKVRVNGVVLHYLERGSGVPVILVHGGLDDYRMWEAQVEPFSQHYHVIVYSRRYNYPNDNSDIRPDHSPIVEADDLAALIKQLNLKAVHIIGHSYGALTALFLAVRHPELVRTLVLAEPPAFSLAQDTPAGLALFNEFMENMSKPTADAFRRGEKEQALRLTIRYFLGDGAFEKASEAQRQYWIDNLREWQATTTSQDPFPMLRREDVKKISAPVLSLSGTRTMPILAFVDSVLQPLWQHQERVILQNATHDMWGEQPDVCRRVTLAFLARH